MLLSAPDAPASLESVWISVRALAGGHYRATRRTALEVLPVRIMPCHPCAAFRCIPFAISFPDGFAQPRTLQSKSCSLAAEPRAMWGSLAVQPLVQWSGRAQTVVAITSLRQFGRGSVAAAAPPPPFRRSPGPWPSPCAIAAVSLRSLSRPQQHRGTWRRPVAQQLHTLADPASAAAGSCATYAIQPGEVHLWWLDPSQVGGAAPVPGSVDHRGVLTGPVCKGLLQVDATAPGSHAAARRSLAPPPPLPSSPSRWPARSCSAAASCSQRRSCASATARGTRPCGASACWRGHTSGEGTRPALLDGCRTRLRPSSNSMRA